MLRFVYFAIIAGSQLTIYPASAHHGDAGRYEDAITMISGTVVALQLVNPHASIIIDVSGDRGQTVRWQAEVSSANGLARVGWTRDTLKPGDRITLFGRVVKSGAPYINLSENARLLRTETCEELYRSGMIFGTPPDYPAPTCE
jgi:hypothetical protein